MEKERRLQKLIISKAKDPYFYIPKLLKIRTKSGDIKPFVPNKPQLKLLDTITELEKKGKPVRIIILKARQMGFSTMTEGLCFQKTSTNTNYRSLIIAHKEKASTNLYNMFKLYFDKLPQFMKPMRKRNNAKEILFENPTTDDIEKSNDPGLQSRVTVATAQDPDAGRSETLNFVHVSELAFWDKPEETMLSLSQAVPNLPNTCIIVESTANGVGDYFYNLWQKAENNEKGNAYVPLFFAWWEMDEYQIPFFDNEEREQFIEEVEYTYKDSKGKEVVTEEKQIMIDYPLVTYEKLNWRRWCIANNCGGDVIKFYQEYPSCPEEAFQSTGRPVFNMSAIKTYLQNCEDGIKGNITEDLEFEPTRDGIYTIYKMPKVGELYSIGSDVAEGLIDGDYSTGLCLDRNMDLVAKLHYHNDPDLHGDELVKFAKFYNEAFLGVENNNHGLTTLKHIINVANYWNVYYTKVVDKATDTVSEKLGWSTTTKTKPIMIDALNRVVRDKHIGIKDKQVLKEMSTYVKDERGRMNAQLGCFDDLVMGLAIALQVHYENYGNEFEVVDSIQSSPKMLINQFEGDTEEVDEDMEFNVEIAE